MAQEPIILTDEIRLPPALIRAGIGALPAAIAAQGERAGRRFIEFFTANIRNRNTRMAYARAVKQFFDWCEDRQLGLDDIEPMTVAAYIEQLGSGGRQADGQAAPGRHPPTLRLSGDRRDTALESGRLRPRS